MDNSTLDVIWILISAGLVFLMQAGFTALESGLTRTKNSINVAMKNLLDIGVSVILFWAVGFALMFGLSQGGWIGSSNFLWSAEGTPWLIAFFIFQALFCGTATTILSGAVAERMNFAGYIIVSVVVSALIYPIFGHWAWNEAGWLGQFGFVDFAGSTVVHSVGGWVALAAVLIIGPRMGRFGEGSSLRKLQSSNVPLAILGVFLLWFGWFGFNGGSTFAANDAVPRVLLNTLLSGAAGAVTPLLLAWATRSLPQIELMLNGALAGLVGVTAAANAVSPTAAIFIGIIAGLVMVGVDRAMVRLKIDDAVGAIPVHLAAGIWGTLAVGLFADLTVLNTGLSRVGQIGTQFLGIVICGIWAFGLSYIILKTIDRIRPLRVSPDDEHRGLNVSEHGATTELHDLVTTMQTQALTSDITLRVEAEPFTEVGQIAQHYNRVLDALQEAVGRTESIVRSIHDTVITFNEDGVLTSLNPSVERMFGYSVAELVGQPISMLINSQDNGFGGGVATLSAPAVLFDLSGNQRHRLIGRRKNNEEFPIEITTSRIEAPNTAPTYTGVLRDISRRMQREEDRQSELQRRTEQVQISTDLVQEISTTANNTNTLLDLAVNRIQERFDYDYVQIFIIASESLVARSGVGKGDRKLSVTNEQILLDAQPSLIAWAAREGRSILVPDVSKEPNYLPAPHFLEVKTELVVPIMLEDQVLGVLDIVSNEVNGLNKEDELLMIGLCGQIAIALDNIQLRDSLEDRLRELSIYRREEGVRGWNAFLERDGNASQNYLYDLTETRSIPIEEVQRAEVGQAVQEAKVVSDDSSALVVAPLQPQAGQVIGVLGVADDDGPPLSDEEQALVAAVSEQVSLALEGARLFDQTQSALQETNILQQFGRALTGLLEIDQIIDVFNQTCIHQLKFDYVEFSLVDKIQQRVKAVGGLGISEAQLLRSNQPLDSDNIMAEIIRTGATEVITGWDDRFDRENFEAEGHAEWVRIFMPIKLRTENIGLVETGLKRGVPEAIQESRLRMLTSLVGQVALALDNAQRYQARQVSLRREQIIREITGKMRNAANVEQLAKITAEELGKNFSAKHAVVDWGIETAKPDASTNGGKIQTNGHSD